MTGSRDEAISQAAALLGPLEAKIMAVVWQQGETTVRAVLAALPANPPLAYTTIMTVMGRLAAKGALVRSRHGKAFRYRPAKTPEQFIEDVSRSRIEDLVAEFGDLAIAHFADAVSKVSPDRLEALRQRIGADPRLRSDRD